MTETETCEECSTLFPDRFYSPMFVNGEYFNFCPECALKVTNRVHGMNRKKFKGEMAQQMLEDFRKWKKKNRKQGKN